MRINQGVPEDNQKTPQIPEYIPPLTIFAPWCFEVYSVYFNKNLKVNINIFIVIDYIFIL